MTWFIGHGDYACYWYCENSESSFPNGVIFQDNFKFNTVSNSSCDCLCKTMDFAVWAIIVKGCSCSLTFISLFSFLEMIGFENLLKVLSTVPIVLIFLFIVAVTIYKKTEVQNQAD